MCRYGTWHACHLNDDFHEAVGYSAMVIRNIVCTPSLPTIRPLTSLRHFHAVPLTYARHTSRFLSLFCLTAPIALVGELGECFLHRITSHRTFPSTYVLLFDRHQLILIPLSLSIPPPTHIISQSLLIYVYCPHVSLLNLSLLLYV